MTEYKRYTITSALPYANGPVHIGHLAGVYVPADIYARYLRGKGKNVVFIGGSDEHGVPVTIRAKKEGITVQEVVDRYHELIKKSFEEFGISFDIYSRTTSSIHHKFASDFFRTLYDKGQLEEHIEEQYCDEVTGEFLTDRNIVGTCPRCGAEGAYGDQCEKCGRTLSPDELINPTNKNNPGNGLIKKATKNWYLPLNRYQDWLKEWVKNAKRPFFIGAHHQPEEVLIGKDKIASAFANCPLFAGYIHGHNHRWRKNWYQDGTYSRTMVKRSVCLPSTGWWGDIGYAEMRTFADRAELKLVETDFYFPRPLNPGEKRPREWDEILSENRACAHMTFPF